MVVGPRFMRSSPIGIINSPWVGAMTVGVSLASLLSPSQAQSPSAPVRSEAAAQMLLDERTAGCAVCARMTREVIPGEFVDDAHQIACAVCHHPHVRRTDEGWQAVCSSPDCHPRAWTRTIFHRLDPEVFVDCQNCHKPHIWRVDGSDCLSCHESFVESAGMIPVSQVHGVREFSHAIHDHLDCSRCHRSVEKHAELLISDRAQCMECHHGAEAGVDCTACHRAGIVGPRSIPETFAFAQSMEARTRAFPFSHDRHQTLPCTECHAEGGSRTDVDCARCHTQHHRAEAQCSICHETPAAGVHSLSVHEMQTCSGSGCHRDGLAFDPMPQDQRNICAACHTNMQDHHPDRPCSQCHVMPPREEAR